MIENLEVPKKLVGPFKRVVRRIPVDLRKDEELIRTVLAYLQMGGEKLARQAVETARLSLELEMAEKKKKARDEALIRAAEARLAAANEESSEDEDEDDEDFEESDEDATEDD
jgi:hypothetical protein